MPLIEHQHLKRLKMSVFFCGTSTELVAKELVSPCHHGYAVAWAMKKS